MRILSALILSVAFNSGCANFSRAPGSGYSSAEEMADQSSEKSSDRSLRQTAYELGKDPATLSSRDMAEIRDRQKVRELERTLISKKEKEQYSKVLPWFRDDQEKISFLSIPSLEGRQQWINSQGIWDRTRAPQTGMKQLVDSQDIAVGMPQEYVRRSWGEPLAVEVSGNPIYKNERWRYQRMVSSSEGYRKEIRFVYFEAGRVVGWETE
ncbi:hypothetical protein D3C87_102060 [compost metagenome]